HGARGQVRLVVGVGPHRQHGAERRDVVEAERPCRQRRRAGGGTGRVGGGAGAVHEVLLTSGHAEPPVRRWQPGCRWLPGRGAQIAWRRCSSAKASHPGGTGSQKVAARNSSTAGSASDPGTPAATSAATVAASTAPSPPGVGAAEPTALPARYAIAVAVAPRSTPTARTQANRAST